MKKGTIIINDTGLGIATAVEVSCSRYTEKIIATVVLTKFKSKVCKTRVNTGRVIIAMNLI